ncbi:hypothetical protein C8J57DRAFT_1499977 [Mycena rebaudengoi]|nr:hypothetical protein C8J57DRAFT_1519976 [Mycena rebaudengoi]KAJ7281273.1 hypothetical protein C8J57DRAFT_1499977 [Mycena rebaudengoi]
MFYFEYSPPPASTFALKAQNRDSDVPPPRPSFPRAFYRFDARILGFFLALVLPTLGSQEIPICGTWLIFNALGASVVSLIRLLRFGRVSCQFDDTPVNWTRPLSNQRDSRQFDAAPSSWTQLPPT